MAHLKINALQSNLVNDIAVLINGMADIPTLLQQVVEKVQVFLEVDRVKIYQFSADGSGQVVAEAIDPASLPTLMGLHFPASDIPAEARQRFHRSPHGTIVDVVSQHKTLCQGVFGLTDQGSLLESGSEIYEPTDPCHLQYLLNMGVLTSLTLPILQNDTIWGLVVVHHSKTKRFTRGQLVTLDVINREVTIAITQRTLLQQAQQQEREAIFLQNFEDRFCQNLNPWSADQGFKAEDVEPLLTEMRHIFKADRSALYFAPDIALDRSGACCVAYSQDPATRLLDSLVNYSPWQTLIQGQRPVPLDQSQPSGQDLAMTIQIVPQVYSTASLREDKTIYQALMTEQVGSLLIIPVQNAQQWWGSLVLFRREKSVEKLWAGRQVNDDRNLIPRQSFQTWCDYQRLTPDWQSSEIQLGKKLGYHFYIALLQKYLSHLIDYQTAHDSVTTLPNANFFCGQLVLALNQAIPAGELVATILIDLNTFKRINDTFGFRVGDQLLREVAQRLETSLKDIKVDHALLARWHGTAFVVLLPRVMDHQAVGTYCRHLLESLQSSFRVQENIVQLKANAGMTLAPYDGETYEILIQRTELALQEAKKQGHSTYLAYNPLMNRGGDDPVGMEYAFRQALEKHAFTVQYQPQIKIETGEVVGLEALLRWNSVQYGGVSPTVFVPMAEKLDLIHTLGLRVFQTVCEQVAIWKQEGLPPCRINVNLSSRQLQNPDLCEQFQQILDRTGVHPQDLALDIRECVVLKNVQETIATLKQLQGMGFEIALDDFGTGYSSLQVLQTLPINTLKIAQEFVEDLKSADHNIALYQAIVSLGKSLNLKIIAEGVETSVQWDGVVSAGVQIVQGYWVSQPMDPGLVMGWIRQQAHRYQLGVITKSPLPGIVSLSPLKSPRVSLSVITNLSAEDAYETVNQTIQQGLLEYGQIHEMMRQQAKRESLLMQVSNKIRQSLDLDYILRTLVTEVHQLLGCDRLFLFQFDADWQGTVVVESVSDPTLSILGEWIDEPCFRNDYVKLYRQGRVRAIDDITQVGLEPCHLEMLQKYQVKANLVLPVLYQDELWGLMIAHDCSAVRHWSSNEITLLTEIAIQAAIAIHQGELYADLQRANQTLETLATLDGLTKIANRRKFDQYLKEEWQRGTRSLRPLSMILCDIDHFKKYNDTYGHQAGDACLQQIAQTLAQTINRPTDLVARYGGEEFALILPDTSTEGAIHLANQLRSKIRALEIPHRASAFAIVTLSMGVATLIPHADQAPRLLIEAADQALYKAKETGRDRYCSQAANASGMSEIESY